MRLQPNIIWPDWPAPSTVRAASTTRRGGASEGIFASLNMGFGRDDEEHVTGNRAAVAESIRLRAPACWLRQVHGTLVSMPGAPQECADACFADRPGRVCVVLTADCLPVITMLTVISMW